MQLTRKYDFSQRHFANVTSWCEARNGKESRHFRLTMIKDGQYFVKGSQKGQPSFHRGYLDFVIHSQNKTNTMLGINIYLHIYKPSSHETIVHCIIRLYNINSKVSWYGQIEKWRWERSISKIYVYWENEIGTRIEYSLPTWWKPDALCLFVH